MGEGDGGAGAGAGVAEGEEGGDEEGLRLLGMEDEEYFGDLLASNGCEKFLCNAMFFQDKFLCNVFTRDVFVPSFLV